MGRLDEPFYSHFEFLVPHCVKLIWRRCRVERGTAQVRQRQHNQIEVNPIRFTRFYCSHFGKSLSWTSITAHLKEYWTSTVTYARESWVSIVAYVLLSGVAILLIMLNVSFWLVLTAGIGIACLFEFMAWKIRSSTLQNQTKRIFLADARRRWLLLLEQREEQVFVALSLLIGALVGLVVVAFIVLTERLGMRLYPVGSAAWRRVSIPVAGSLSMGLLLYRYFPHARGSGVPQAKAALFARDGFISLRTVLGKFFCTATTLASGIPLGREGPSVQVGAGIASVLGRHLGLRQEMVKALLPVGASAAIAAAFNTPMAAVLFALEEVMGDLHAPILGSVVLASATSWAMLRLVLGNDPLFHLPQYELIHPLEFGVYAVLGVLGGLLSAAFTQLLLRMRQRFLLLSNKTAWWHPIVGGVVVGLMGWVVPEVLGVGYLFVGQALNGTMAFKLMAMLVVLKLLAVTTSYASGNAGGIFGPSLFLGAMLGGVVGSVAHHLLPAYTATAGAYATVGMGALFAGIVRAPMTSVLMIFEMTRDYAVIVPLMIANLTSLFISSRLQREPIYEALAHQDGIHLPNHKTREELVHRRVSQVMRSTTETLPALATVQQALEATRLSPLHAWPVMDEGSVVGILSRATLANADESGKSEEKIIDLLESLDFPHVHADHPQHLALERMSLARIDILPVVDRADAHKLVGVVTLRDLLESYGVDSQGSA